MIKKFHKENDKVYVLTGEQYHGNKPHNVFEQYTFPYTGDSIIEVLDSVTEESRRLDGSAITDHIATMACKAAVKGNNKLSFKEADTLIEQLLQAKNPYTCPHGRPTIISLSKYELEKKFKRIQS